MCLVDIDVFAALASALLPLRPRRRRPLVSLLPLMHPLYWPECAWCAPFFRYNDTFSCVCCFLAAPMFAAYPPFAILARSTSAKRKKVVGDAREDEP